MLCSSQASLNSLIRQMRKLRLRGTCWSLRGVPVTQLVEPGLEALFSGTSENACAPVRENTGSSYYLDGNHLANAFQGKRRKNRAEEWVPAPMAGGTDRGGRVRTGTRSRESSGSHRPNSVWATTSPLLWGESLHLGRTLSFLIYEMASKLGLHTYQHGPRSSCHDAVG